jgi:hypothetical protein
MYPPHNTVVWISSRLWILIPMELVVLKLLVAINLIAIYDLGASAILVSLLKLHPSVNYGIPSTVLGYNATLNCTGDLDHYKLYLPTRLPS